MHDIQAISTQTRKTDKLGDALEEHDDDGEDDTADGFFDGPAVEEDGGGHEDAHRKDAGAETVFGDSLAADVDPFVDGVVRPAAAEEGSYDTSDIRDFRMGVGAELTSHNLEPCRKDLIELGWRGGTLGSRRSGLV